jgi:hypothetical protein
MGFERVLLVTTAEGHLARGRTRYMAARERDRGSFHARAGRQTGARERDRECDTRAEIYARREEI